MTDKTQLLLVTRKLKPQYPDYLDDPEGLERFRDAVRENRGHDMAAVNHNSLGRLIDTIDRLKHRMSHSLPGDFGEVRCAHEAYQGQCCHCGVRIVGGRALSVIPAEPVDETERLQIRALRAAEQFIVNGIEMGYITMPDASTPDPAHDTLRLIRAALTTTTGQSTTPLLEEEV